MYRFFTQTTRISCPITFCQNICKYVKIYKNVCKKQAKIGPKCVKVPVFCPNLASVPVFFSDPPAPLNMKFIYRCHGQKMQIRFCIATWHMFVNTLDKELSQLNCLCAITESAMLQTPAQCTNNKTSLLRLRLVNKDDIYNLFQNNVRFRFRNSL